MVRDTLHIGIYAQAKSHGAKIAAVWVVQREQLVSLLLDRDFFQINLVVRPADLLRSFNIQRFERGERTFEHRHGSRTLAHNSAFEAYDATFGAIDDG